MLPTFLLAGLGFALAYGPLNIAATNGVAPKEQGIAAGLLNTSFQFGGALGLAIVTAVDNANRGAGQSQLALLHGFRAAVVVSAVAAALGVAAFAARRRSPAAAERVPAEPESLPSEPEPSRLGAEIAAAEEEAAGAR
jgi:sugar phosphate permease